MAKVKYSKQLTALLLIDPYNDFISEGGKIWHRIRAYRCGTFVRIREAIKHAAQSTGQGA
jgi:hypothetical protein